MTSAFDDAKKQLQRYAAALEKKFGKKLKLRCFAVVSVGFDIVLGEEVLIVANSFKK